MKTGVSGLILELSIEQLCQSGSLRPLCFCLFNLMRTAHWIFTTTIIWQRAWLGKSAWNGFYTLVKRVIWSLAFFQYGGYLVMLVHVCIKQLFQIKGCIYRLHYNAFKPPPPFSRLPHQALCAYGPCYNINVDQNRRIQS